MTVYAGAQEPAFVVKLTLPVYVHEDEPEKPAIVENRSGTIRAEIPCTRELVRVAERRESYWRARMTDEGHDLELLELLGPEDVEPW